MKFSGALLFAALFSDLTKAIAHDTLVSPITKVVGLIKNLKAEIDTDGKVEQQVFDKFACWSEEAIKSKTAVVVKANADIAEAESMIMHLSGSIGHSTTSLKATTDDISDNILAQKHAAEKREAESEAYAAEMQDLVASENAVKVAIQVLSQTSEGSLIEKKKFLGVFQKAKVVRVADGLRSVLKLPEIAGSMTEDDLGAVRDFINRPSDFLTGSPSPKAGIIEVQLSQQNNPFGDFASPSGKILGILKHMLETFTADIASKAQEEEDAIKAYHALVDSRKRELKVLQSQKLAQEVKLAADTKLMAETKLKKAENEKILEGAEAFIEQTKASLKKVTKNWAERCRLRTEELRGIEDAIQFLSDPQARANFEAAATTLVQVKSESVSDAQLEERRQKAYNQLQKFAKGLHGMQLAQIAADLTLGGHFDKVIAAIDQLLVTMRKEEAEDIAHRDRCQNQQKANENTLDDLKKNIDTSKAAIEKMDDDIDDMNADLKAKQEQIEATREAIKNMTKMREDAHEEYVKATKADTEAVMVIAKAIQSLSQYYKNNRGLKMDAFVQKPFNFTSEDDAPRADFSMGDKHSSSTGGIVSILLMIKEDIEMEIQSAMEEEKAQRADHFKLMANMEMTIAAVEAGIATLEKEKADMQSTQADEQEELLSNKEDEKSENEAKSTLDSDCSWVATHFETRRTKRKSEMQGLTDAKAYLAGIMT